MFQLTLQLRWLLRLPMHCVNCAKKPENLEIRRKVLIKKFQFQKHAEFPKSGKLVDPIDSITLIEYRICVSY